MNAWGAFCNVQFTETATNPQVRIARTGGDGYWSYLGTDVLHIAAGQPTMNLDSFTMNTADSEFHRVIRHETGHTLGFPHEHLRKEIVNRIDRAKALQYFESTQGWSESDGHRPGSHAAGRLSPRQDGPNGHTFHHVPSGFPPRS